MTWSDLDGLERPWNMSNLTIFKKTFDVKWHLERKVWYFLIYLFLSMCAKQERKSLAFIFIAIANYNLNYNLQNSLFYHVLRWFKVIKVTYSQIIMANLLTLERAMCISIFIFLSFFKVIQCIFHNIPFYDVFQFLSISHGNYEVMYFKNNSR